MRAGKSPEERHWREYPRRGDYSVKGDEPLQYPLPKSTSFHPEDREILYELPSYPGSLAGRPSTLGTTIRVRLSTIGILPHMGNLLLEARPRRFPLSLEFLDRTL